MTFCFRILALFLLATPAQAYIGPGVGFGAVFTLVSVLVGVMLLVVGFIWYPLKRALRKKRGGGADRREADAGPR